MNTRSTMSKRQKRNACKIGFLYFQDINVFIKLDEDGNIDEENKKGKKNKKKLFAQEDSLVNDNSQARSKTLTPSNSSNLEQSESTSLEYSDDSYDNSSSQADNLFFSEKNSELNLRLDTEFEILNEFGDFDGLTCDLGDDPF